MLYTFPMKRWLLYTISYRSLSDSGWVYGIGWRRWVLLLHCNAYHRPGWSLHYCNYYGEGGGG